MYINYLNKFILITPTEQLIGLRKASSFGSFAWLLWSSISVIAHDV